MNTSLPFYSQDIQKISRELDVDLSAGLSAEEAVLRLKRFGPNEIPRTGRRNPLRILGDQFLNPMILLLVAVVGISMAIGHLTDAFIIAIIVLLNAGIGFVQEMKAEKAMESIRNLAAPEAKVLRGGTLMKIPARALVPGDIVRLEAGDRIPADLRISEEVRLQVDESLLTGESVPVFKSTAILQEAELPLGDQANMGFMGTHVVGGRGTGIVIGTGHSTELGRIAKLLTSDKNREVPLKKRLNRLTRQLGTASILLCLVIFGVGVFRGEAVLDMFLTAISLAVAAIPEGLAAVITISLSLGSLRLASRGVLVRLLPAVEGLGSVTVICADKTGTLTENKMAVKYPQASDATLHPLFFQTLVLCNDANLGTEGRKAGGDPMEIALLEFATNAGWNPDVVAQKWPRLHEVPFDTDRKRMTTFHGVDGKKILFMKGAPEMVLSLCSQEQRGNEIVPLSPQRREELGKFQENLAFQGLRILATATRDLAGVDFMANAESLEQNAVFLGFVGLQDPPRAEAAQAIKEARMAGIRPVMITGDYGVTATAIGRELGIYTEGDRVITGADLKRETREWLDENARHTSIFARVSPEDKLSIIQVLKDDNEFVAMTGDGVNDAPALRRADIGIAMGRGTDVAKEASALILVKEDFSTIVHAIKEGRVIYDNIRKFVRYMLTTNLGEIATMLIAALLNFPVLLIPVQILWINLVTDGLPAVALGFEPAEGNVMARKPRPPRESILARGLWQHTVWVGILMGVLTIGVVGFFRNAEIELVRTLAFTTLTFAQMGHVLAIRSESQPLWRIGILSNYRLTVAVLLTITSQFLLVYYSPLQKIFHTVPLTLSEVGICFLPAIVIYGAVEAEKFFFTSLTRGRPCS